MTLTMTSQLSDLLAAFIPGMTWLGNPDLAVLLMVFGGMLIYLEFNLPGTVLPGAIGTLCVLVGAFALSQLPLSHPALAALFAALVLILLEAKFFTHGILAAAGTLCLVFGLATLVHTPVPELRVHLSTAIAAGVGFGAVSFFLAGIALRARRSKVLTGPEAMLRQIATVVTPLDPSGQVEVRGELWQARLTAPAATLTAGSRVKVDALEGLTLLVTALDKAE
jgi:membrane-bound serine protease (ClpP class)